MEGKNAKQATTDKKTNFIKDYGNVIASGFLAIVTLILVLIAYQQTQIAKNAAASAQQSVLAIEKSVNISEQSMKISNRPYVIVKGAKPENTENLNDFIAKITVGHSGKTPAFKTRTIGGLSVFERTVTENPDYNTIFDDPKSEAVLGSDIPITFNLSFKSKLSNEIIKKIRNEELYIYAHGLITYEDIFKDSHFTKFFLRYNTIKNNFSIYPEYNETN